MNKSIYNLKGLLQLHAGTSEASFLQTMQHKWGYFIINGEEWMMRECIGMA